jgi:1-acyl-sn-glycerol-3-phosphate acyltransferase
VTRVGRFLSSAAFNIFFHGWVVFLLFTLWIALWLPPAKFRRVVELWPIGTNWALRTFCHIGVEVRGRENIPAGAAIYAVKHQSTWETAALLTIVPHIAYAMKAELLKIPFWKWYMTRAEHLAVDRRGGASSVRRMIQDAKAILDQGRSVAVFPEGTRTAPGSTGDYHPGIAALYSQLDAPVVPVALNSGLFWGRRTFLKTPGTIIIEFLPPMPADLNRREFVADLQARIESATRRLEDDGRRAAALPAA